MIVVGAHMIWLPFATGTLHDVIAPQSLHRHNVSTIIWPCIAPCYLADRYIDSTDISLYIYLFSMFVPPGT